MNVANKVTLKKRALFFYFLNILLPREVWYEKLKNEIESCVLNFIIINIRSLVDKFLYYRSYRDILRRFKKLWPEILISILWVYSECTAENTVNCFALDMIVLIFEIHLRLVIFFRLDAKRNEKETAIQLFFKNKYYFKI